MEIHIGQKIREELERQGRSKVWFANAINRSNSTCYYLFKSKTIDTELLTTICKVLNFNFFKLYSDELSGALSKKLEDSV